MTSLAPKTLGWGPLVATDYLGTTVEAFANRPRSLSGVVRAAAARWPERTAVIAGGGALTYAELDSAVDQAAAGLAAQGVGSDDRVAVALGHDLPLLLVPFACSRVGATALLVNTTLAPPLQRAQIERVGARVVVTDAGPLLDGAARSTPPEAAEDEDRPVALIATSGTTGVPKTTQITSRGLIHAALAYVELLGLTADGPNGPERSLVVLPLHTIGPWSAQLTAMPLVGGVMVLPADPGPAAAVRAMQQHQITHLDAVPAWLGVFARQPDLPPLPAWRTLIYGGAPMPARTAAVLADAYPSLAVWDLWGLSETHGPATALRYDAARPAPAGTVGRPIAGVAVRAVRLDGDRPAPVPPGEAGELVVRGANVTPGYLDDPDTTAAVLSDGWLRTGDIGTVAADGTVRILDRAKDVILRGGTNVFSVEVEQVLAAAPGVVEAAVYGVADELGGEAVAAAVVLDGSAALDGPALRRLVVERVGVHAVPRRMTVVDALPRNPNGKVDKHRLRREHP